MKITFSKPSLNVEGAVVVGILEDRVLTPSAAEIDERAGGALIRAMTASRFQGKKDQVLTLLVPPGLEVSRVLLIGLGKAEEITALSMQAFGGIACANLAGTGVATAAAMIDGIEGCSVSSAEMAANVAFGLTLRSYRFDKYRTKEKPDEKPGLKKFQLLTGDVHTARKLFEPLEKVAGGVFFTRDLVSEPGNVIYPESLANAARKLSELGIEVEVLGRKQMKKLGMGALLGVAQGSENDPQFVILRWQGAIDAKAQPIAFVGKGVTFDTGGISIKPAAGMEDMKYDMGGAGIVFGLMKTLAGRKARVNAVGIAGLVENMPSGTAQRPGDIVTSMSGQTIEVINTDAEGRLVLADALWYTKETFNPKFMIDLATLTGAIVVSLGSGYAGLFSNDDDLAEKLNNAGKATGEMVWRMPMGEDYDKLLKSDAADMQNVGGGREAGSITAAQFLKRFVGDVPWAHLDIAGVTWTKKDKPTCPKGSTAFGIRLLNRLVADHFEDREG
ncbi:MAG: leucyl aminopeptidase [Alphaproteobacteria bacterium]